MKNSARYGFTLVELLVSTAILALLITLTVVLLVPSLSNVQDHRRATVCKANLKKCVEGINSAPGKRPYPQKWRRFLMDRGVEGVLICPSDADADKIKEPDNSPDLEDVYLVQAMGGNVRFSNIKMILDAGVSVEDNQIRRVDSAHGVTAGEGQALIIVGSECAMMRVTLSDETRFESIIIPTTHTGHSTIHWLCVDDGRPDWRDHVRSEISGAKTKDEIFVMRLQTGHIYTVKDDDYTIRNHQRSSYAMSNAVDSINPRPGQLMLVEWTKDVARVLERGYRTDNLGGSNDDPKGCLRTRHFDMANFALVDGSVKSMTREDMQSQRDAYTPVRHEGIWAP